MAGETLAFDVFAKDRASKVFDKVGDAAEKTEKRFGRFSSSVGVSMRRTGASLFTVGRIATTAVAGAAVGGVTALGLAMFKGVKAAEKYQTLGFKTQAVIKSTGNVAHVSVKGIQKLAASLESLSGVDEELIINSQNVLLTFTKVRNEAGKGNDIFNRATKAALDMSVALGTDLQSSTIQLGKALNDPIKGITALQRVGVSFTADQKKQIKTLVESGHTLEAQKVILKELATEFGGAAKAAGKGFGGAMARAKDAVGDLWRDIGTRLLPALTSVADWVATVGVPAFASLVDFVANKVAPKISAAFLAIKAKLPTIDISGLGKNFSKQAEGWSGGIIAGIKKGLDTGDWSGLGKSLGDKMANLVVGTGGLALKLVEAFKNVDWFELGKKVGRTAIPFALGFVTTFFDGLVDAVREHPWESALAVASFVGVGKALGQAGKLVAKLPFLKFFAPVLNGIGKVADLVAAPFLAVGRFISRNFIEGFAKHFPGVATKLKSGIDNIVTFLYVKADDAGKAALRFVAAIPRGIGSGLGAVTSAALKVIKVLLSPFANSGIWLIGKGKAVVVGLARGITSVVGSLIGSAARIVIGALVKPFGPAASWLISAGRAVMSGLASGIRNRIGGVVADVRSVRSRVIGAVSGAGSWLVGAGRAVISGFISGIRSMAGEVASEARSVVSRAVDAAKRALGIGSPSKVFAEIGRNVGKGYVTGLADTQRSVTAAVTGLIAPTPSGTVSGVGIPTLSNTTGVRGGGGGVNIYGEVHLHGVEDMAAFVRELETYAAKAGGVRLRIRTA